MSADFFVVPTATGRLLFVLVILAHARRRVACVAVTEHPTAAWTGQQLREAFPWDQAPRYLVRDRDHAFAGWTNTARALGIEEILTAPRSPWQRQVQQSLSWFTLQKEKLAQPCPLDWVWRERRGWSSETCRRLVEAGSSGGPLAYLGPDTVTDARGGCIGQRS